MSILSQLTLWNHEHDREDINMAALTGEQHFDGWDAESVMLVTVTALSVYNSCELLMMIASKFKEHKSLYFISLTVSTIGVLPYFGGFCCEYFRAIPYWLSMSLSTVGWVALITGQAVVLYSRLGLILDNARILKAVKWMIIFNAITLHTTTTVLQFGKVYAHGSSQTAFLHGIFYFEKIQMTMFCLQEFIISGLYLWKTLALLKIIQKQGTRRVMMELFVINILIVIGDIALLVLEYSGHRVEERLFKGLVYSVKLKLEFAILSKLVGLVQSSQRTLSNALAEVDTFVDASRTTSAALLPVAHQPKSAADQMPDWLAKLEDRHVQHVEHIEHIEHVEKISEPDPFVTRKDV